MLTGIKFPPFTIPVGKSKNTNEWEPLGGNRAGHRRFETSDNKNLFIYILFFSVCIEHHSL